MIEARDQSAQQAGSRPVFETMSSGRIAGHLHSILEMVGRGRGTRLVAVTHRRGQAVLVLHNGGIRYAVRNGVEERVLNHLEMRRVIGHEAIDLARSQQNQAGAPLPLGTLLLEQRAVTEAALQEALAAVAVADLQEVLSWQHGIYRVITPADLGARGEDVLRACAAASSARQRQILERRLAAVWHERIAPSKVRSTGAASLDLLEDLNDFAFTTEQMAGPLGTLADDGRTAWLACLLPAGMRFQSATGEVANPVAMRDARLGSLLSRLAPREAHRLESLGAWLAAIEVQGEIVAGLLVDDGDRPATSRSLLRVADWIERMCLRSAEEVTAARLSASWRLLDNWLLAFAHAHHLAQFEVEASARAPELAPRPRLVPRQARAMALPRSVLAGGGSATASKEAAHPKPDDETRPLVYRLP